MNEDGSRTQTVNDVIDFIAVGTCTRLDEKISLTLLTCSDDGDHLSLSHVEDCLYESVIYRSASAKAAGTWKSLQKRLRPRGNSHSAYEKLMTTRPSSSPDPFVEEYFPSLEPEGQHWSGGALTYHTTIPSHTTPP